MRRALTAALVGLAAVLLVVGMVAVWADDLLLSPAHWETTSRRLLANPTVRSGTASYLADQIVAQPQLSDVLGGSSVAAARGVIVHAIDAALGVPPVRTLWAKANRAVAAAVSSIVNGRRGPATVQGGAVTVSLGPILRAVAARAHVPAAVIASLPKDAGTLIIVRSDRLHTVQTAGRALRDLARWVVFAVPALWLAALALARGRRRPTLAWIGVTAALGGAVVIGARTLLITPAAHAISDDASLQRIIAAALTTVSTTLGHLALGVGLAGLAVGATAGLVALRARSPRRPRARSRSLA